MSAETREFISGTARPDHVVIVGAGLAGLRTAEQLRQSGYTGRTTMIGAEAHPPYDRPPLTKGFLRGAVDRTELRKEYDSICDDLRLGTAAIRLDAEGRLVELSDGTSISFDVLVLALGAEPRRMPSAAGGEHTHVVRTIDHAERLRQSLQSRGPVVVIGGGFVGCEVAASARTLGCDVTLIEADVAGPLARALGAVAASEVAHILESHGVVLKSGTSVDEVRDDCVVLHGGTTVQADTVVAGLGAQPRLEWLESSGLHLADGIVCSSSGETSDASIYAVGDAARWDHPLLPGGRRTEHWTSAADQGRTVAANILRVPGEPRVVNDAVPYFWCDIADTKIQVVGFIEPAHDVVPVPGTDRRVMLYSDRGRLTGGITFSLPRALVQLRRLVQDRASLNKALDALS